MIERFLFQPVTPFHVNQGFGEDRACISTTDNKTIISKESSATCPIGYRSFYTQTKGHNGIDLTAKRWQPVYAAHDGVVNEVQTEVERGLGVGIVSDRKYFCIETNKPEHFKSRYWHFIALDVHLGEVIKTGDLIGYADSTGFSSGDHLHLELKPVTIRDYEKGVPICDNVLQNNGYLGAVNALPYFEMISALKIAGIVRQLAELTARVADFIADFARTRS